jgi:hypothetical protein
MKLVSYYMRGKNRTRNHLADYVRVRVFECVRVRVHVVDYDHVEKFCSPL